MPRWLLFTLISALLWCGWWMVFKLAAPSVAFPQTQLLFAIGRVEIAGVALAVGAAVAISCERIAQA